MESNQEIPPEPRLFELSCKAKILVGCDYRHNAWGSTDINNKINLAELKAGWHVSQENYIISIETKEIF